jgi:adenosylcobinamide-GDP ribazoletransferase
MKKLNYFYSTFFAAFTFLTRIPGPKEAHYSPELLADSLVFFPVVGAIVGVVSAIIWLIVGSAYPEPIAAVFTVATAAIITGAFHEDAFADVCDGFGGWTPSRRLEIMRDSRVGSFAVTGLSLLILAKVLLLGSLTAWSGFAALIAAHSVSRWSSVYMTTRFPYVTDGASLAKPFAQKTTFWKRAAAFLFTLPFLIPAGLGAAGFYLVCTVIICEASGRFFQQWLGGISGDCLGAVNQMVELAGYMIITHRLILDTLLPIGH